MLFNSVDFALFLPVIFCLYWFIAHRSFRSQNFLLLLASYFFYCCWDYRFLSLLLFSTALDYLTGIKINLARNKGSRKLWLWISILVNLGFLGIFKYYNFFAESFGNALALMKIQSHPLMLDILLPVGISFYTFHGLSYVIDIYKNRIEPEKNFVDYALFVSFFPLLVAGPIERATHLLPQLKKERKFEYAAAVDGMRQILWGLFKKIVIADNCAQYATMIFNGHGEYSGSTLIIGAVLFSFQIYCDFSGYSDIAIGTARLFGIDLLRNFAFPYFSRNIAEFWRRWHISLSSWFRDYLYIPLGGSKKGQAKTIRNVLIVFLVSGFWHGANWTFIAWGLLHAVYIMPSVLLKTNRTYLGDVAKGRILPSLSEFLSMLATFTLTTFAWIFFRSASITDAFAYISGIGFQLFTKPEVFPVTVLLILLAFVTIEWFGRKQQYALAFDKDRMPRVIRWGIYYAIVFFTIVYGASGQQFIYFQF
jgi:alginate O-acetyltransferase complex protein AlgI